MNNSPISTIKTHILNAIAEAAQKFCNDHDFLTNLKIESKYLVEAPENADGDLAFACFILVGKLDALETQMQKNPAAIATQLCKTLTNNGTIFDPYVSSLKAQGPYINFTLNTEQLAEITIKAILTQGENYPSFESTNTLQLYEFSAPNTNKPQHLGHVRNNVLGDACANLARKNGHEVARLNLINDRGIHICKSMLAHATWTPELTPESSGQKGDHLIGDAYVAFDRAFKKEYNDWLESTEGKAQYQTWLQSAQGSDVAALYEAAQKPGASKKQRKKAREPYRAFVADYRDIYFNTQSQLGKLATEMLVKWEAEDPETRELWRKYNNWVLAGFEQTYADYGIEFDHIDYESQTYRLGRDIIERGLQNGLFERRNDGAVIFKLEKIGLQGEKVLLRANQTSVYMTQDIGTAMKRFEKYDFDRLTYVVADEQNHHFKLLFAILEAIEPKLKNRLKHLSYGMVLLPHGRMKSREGTVVDADMLLNEVADLVLDVMNQRDKQQEDEKHTDDSKQKNTQNEELDADRQKRARTIALAAIKFFLLDVTPSSSLEFNPERSIDLQGRTGAYCLMNYARTRSILRKAGYDTPIDRSTLASDAFHCTKALLSPTEKALLLMLAKYSEILEIAHKNDDPSRLAEYLYHLCKRFAYFFTDRQNHAILTCENKDLKVARLQLVDALSTVLKDGLNLLGITTLEIM